MNSLKFRGDRYAPSTQPSTQEAITDGEQAPLLVQLAAAREDWAQKSAKRQNRSFDRKIHGYNDAEKRYDELKLAYGRELLETELADTQDPTERNRIAIQYLIDEDKRLRNISDNYAENTVGRRVSRALGKWLTAGNRLTKVAKNIAVSGIGAAAGTLVGSVSAGLGVAGYARGYSTAERSSMRDSSLQADEILSTIGDHPTNFEEIFKAANQAAASRFETDIKGRQAEVRSAIKRGLGKSAIGLVVGGVIDVATAGTEAVASEYQTMTSEYQAMTLADSGVDSLAESGSADYEYLAESGLADYSDLAASGSDSYDELSTSGAQNYTDLTSSGAEGYAYLGETSNSQAIGDLVASGAEDYEYLAESGSADYEYLAESGSADYADLATSGTEDVTDLGADDNDTAIDEPAEAVAAPDDAEIKLASDGQMFTGVNPEVNLEELPVIDNGEGIISFASDNYGLDINNNQALELGEKLHQEGYAYTSDYLLDNFDNQYGLVEPGQVDPEMHNIMLDYADDGQFNESYADSSVEASVDGDTDTNGDSGAETDPAAADAAVDAELISQLETIVDTGDYSQLNEIDNTELKLGELARALDGAEYSDGSPIVSLEDGEYKFKDQPAGATINSLSTLSIITDHISGLQPDVNSALSEAFDLAA